jgi:alpha-1,2-mannosyltransferase
MVRWLGVPRRTCWGITGLATAGLLWLEPVQATLHFGQVNLLVMLLVLADLARRPRWIPPGVLIGAATGLKLVPAIFIVYLLVAGRGRAAGTAIAVFAGSVAIGFLATPGQSAAYWTRFAFDTGRVGSISHVSNQSLYGLIARLSGSPGAAHSGWLAAALAVGIFGLWVAAVLHRAGHVVSGGLACACTGLLVSPVSWNHHWVWAAPVAIALGHHTWQTRNRWTGLALVAWLAIFVSRIIWQVPRSFGREHHWHSWQLIAGNAYILAGLIALVALAGVAYRTSPKISQAGGNRTWKVEPPTNTTSPAAARARRRASGRPNPAPRFSRFDAN